VTITKVPEVLRTRGKTSGVIEDSIENGAGGPTTTAGNLAPILKARAESCPRRAFLCVPSMFDSFEMKVLYPT
jgi:hypothetical protein